MIYLDFVLIVWVQLFEVSSANEWKTIDVKSMFPESDGQTEVHVKCSTWSADGKRVICAARNAVFVSITGFVRMYVEVWV